MGLEVTSRLESLEAARQARFTSPPPSPPCNVGHRCSPCRRVFAICSLHTHGVRPINKELTVATPCVTADDAMAQTGRDVDCVLTHIEQLHWLFFFPEVPRLHFKVISLVSDHSGAGNQTGQTSMLWS